VPESHRQSRPGCRSATSSDQVELLRELSLRCRSGSAPSPDTIEAALEQAFAELITLEAELQRGRKLGASATTRDMEAIASDIEALREATEELRSLTTPGSPEGYGFVAPRSPTQLPKPD
jgi:voltage-gated potassium channel Kch